MEKQESIKLDPREEVRKLQEMVRKLELQNEELRIGSKKNGLILDSQKQPQPKQISKEEDDNSSLETLIDINCEELEGDQTWLHRSSKNNGDLNEIDLDTWLKSELSRGVPSVDITGFKYDISRRLTEVKRSVEQRQVDTRTFTRPKKRLALSTPNIQPEYVSTDMCKELTPEPTRPSVSDEENTPVPNGPLLNVHNSQHVRDRSLPRYTGTNKASVLEGTYRLERSATPERVLSQSGRNTPDRKPNTGLPVPRSRMDKTFGYRTGSCSPLNRTFNLDGVPVRAGEGMEEDQMSSASDSSFSSSHRAMTAGEVRTLARMQEESLKFSSTPHWKSNPEGRNPVHQMSSDLPSPITRSTEDFHSDQSSVEGGRSSRSSVVGDSLHSSPAGSPFGSSQALMTLARPTDCMVGSNEALDRPPRNAPNKMRVEGGTRGLVRPMISAATRGQSAGAQGIKPQCLVRPSVVQNNLGGSLAAPVNSSGIPRPQGLRAPGSRIPAPRARTAVSKTQDWMDGCY